MAIAMVAMLAFGGTYAYFTASSGGSLAEPVTLGLIAHNSEVTVAETVKDKLPTETFDITLTITDTSNRESFIFIDLTESLHAKANHEEDCTDCKGTVSIVDVELATNANGTLKTHEIDADNSIYYIDATTAAGTYTLTVTIEISADTNNCYQEGTVQLTVVTEQVQGNIDIDDAYAIAFPAADEGDGE